MIIGVDPHKSTHTATAVDAATNTAVASVRVAASAAGYRRLLGWARQFGERRWAVENARGLGCHLAQWLVAHGETVLDASTAATARVRELSRGGRRKNDVIDASAAASVAALQGDAAAVAADDDTVVFALLEERRASLAAQRVRSVNQLHEPPWLSRRVLSLGKREYGYAYTDISGTSVYEEVLGHREGPGGAAGSPVARRVGHRPRDRQTGGGPARLWHGVGAGLGASGDIDDGGRPGTTTGDRERLKVLEQEVRELRRANAILKSASAFFAAELDRPHR